MVLDIINIFYRKFLLYKEIVMKHSYKTIIDINYEIDNIYKKNMNYILDKNEFSSDYLINKNKSLKKIIKGEYSYEIKIFRYLDLASSINENNKKELDKLQKLFKKELRNNFQEKIKQTKMLHKILNSYSHKINSENWEYYNKKIEEDITKIYTDAVIPNYLTVDKKVRKVNFLKDYQDDLKSELNNIRNKLKNNENDKLLEKILRAKTYSDIKQIEKEIFVFKKLK